MIINRTVNIFNDNVMAHFRKILKHKKIANIGQINIEKKNHPKQISAEPKKRIDDF